MRIGVVGPLPPLRGGISHYNDSLAGALLRTGHDVTAISYSRLYPRFLYPGSSEREESGHASVDVQEILVAWNPVTWKRARKKLAEAEIDRLVIHHWHPFFSPCHGYLCKKRPGNGVVLIAHNVLPHEHRTAGRILNPRLFKLCDRVLVGSSEQLKLLEEIVPGVQGVVAPHPASDRFYKITHGISRENARKTLGYGPDEPLFVHVGLIRGYKGVDVLIEAFARMKRVDAKLEIAGEFYEPEREYRELVRKLKLDDRVRIVNRYLEETDMAMRLIAADAVVLPYRHVTQSGIAMAVLACGTPVIATEVGALADVIEPGVSGDLVPPEDPGALAASMDGFLEGDRHVRESGRENIARRIQKKFSWETLVERVAEPL